MILKPLVELNIWNVYDVQSCTFCTWHFLCCIFTEFADVRAAVCVAQCVRTRAVQLHGGPGGGSWGLHDGLSCLTQGENHQGTELFFFKLIMQLKKLNSLPQIAFLSVQNGLYYHMHSTKSYVAATCVCQVICKYY